MRVAKVPVTCLTCGRVVMRYPSQIVGSYCSRRCWAIGKCVDPVEYFWQHVEKSDGCWLWTAERNNTGYGAIPRSFRRRGACVEIKAHRFAWVIANGAVPDGLLVLHRCDNPPCVRIDHLFLGTHKDNAADRDQKGRANPPIGERAFGAKLSPPAVQEIRRLYADGATLEQLAAQFGISHGNVSRVVRGDMWKHVGGPCLRLEKARGERSGAAKLTADDVRAIRAAYAAGGVRQEDLARRYGVGHSAIGNILLRQTWAHVA